jgi:putative holliday junction resolvase
MTGTESEQAGIGPARLGLLRILALDYGERRIGVAVSDPTGMLAQPLETIDRKRGKTGPLERIGQLVREYAVERIILGLPLHMDGRAGEEVATVQRFGAQVSARTGVPVEYLDERWTTVEAGRALQELGVRGQRRRERIDATAAAILLRAFLERGAARCSRDV